MRIYERAPKEPSRGKENTHRWFAWFPVRAQDNNKTCLVWLETIWRRKPHLLAYEYQIIPDWAKQDEKYNAKYPFLGKE